MLPPFTFNTTVSSEHSRQDRLELILDLGKLEGTTREIDSFRKALSPVQEDGFSMYLPSHGWIFSRPHQKGTYRLPQTVRKKKSREYTSIPLFSGSLEYGGYYRPYMDDVTTARLRLDLNCNPTRSARFTRLRRDGSEIASDVFAREAVPQSENGEIALDAKNNWVLAGRVDEHFTPARWRHHVRRYIRQIQRAIDDDVRTARLLSGTEAKPREGPLFSLKHVETYWEFQSPNPLALVQSIRPLMSSFASGGRDTEYEGNGMALRYNVAKGVTLCIYAKTNHRIRVEVRHKLAEYVPPAIGNRTAGTIGGVMHILEACQNAASNVVNRALTHLRNRGQIAPSQINEAHLLIRIGRIIKNDSIALLIVEALRCHGGVAPDNRAASLRKGLAKLQRHSVLQWDATAGLYVPSNDCSHAAMTLQSREDSLIAPANSGVTTTAAPGGIAHPFPSGSAQIAHLFPTGSPPVQAATRFPARSAPSHTAPPFPSRKVTKQASTLGPASPVEVREPRFPSRRATKQELTLFPGSQAEGMAEGRFPSRKEAKQASTLFPASQTVVADEPQFPSRKAPKEASSLSPKEKQ